MANVRFIDETAQVTPLTTDVYSLVDVTDFTQSGSGTQKKITWGTLLANIPSTFPFITLGIHNNATQDLIIFHTNADVSHNEYKTFYNAADEGLYVQEINGATYARTGILSAGTPILESTGFGGSSGGGLLELGWSPSAGAVTTAAASFINFQYFYSSAPSYFRIFYQNGDSSGSATVFNAALSGTGVTTDIQLGSAGANPGSLSYNGRAINPNSFVDTFKGIVTCDGSGNFVKLDRGTNGYLLQSDSLASSGFSWVSPAAPVDHFTDLYVTNLHGNPGGTTINVIDNITATKYQIGGNDALSIDSPNTSLYVGVPIPTSITGTNNVVVGLGSFTTSSMTTSHNTVLGNAALHNGGLGNQTAVGYQALMSPSSSSDSNVAIGSQAMKGDVAGVGNVGIGTLSMQFETTGSYNVGAGYGAFPALTTGSRNIALGRHAGATLLTGTDNIFIGDTSITTNNAIAHAICIGSSVSVPNSHDVYIGETSASGDFKVNGRNINLASFVDGNTASIICDGSGNFVKSNSVFPTWTVVSGVPTYQMATNNSYIAFPIGTVFPLIFTLPTTAAVGDVLNVFVADVGKYMRINCNAGQTIQWGTSVTSSGGYLVSGHGASIQLICCVANTTWQAISVIASFQVN